MAEFHNNGDDKLPDQAEQGHPPIFSNKRKTTQRSKKAPRKGGIETLKEAFKPLSTEEKEAANLPRSDLSQIAFRGKPFKQPETPPMSSPAPGAELDGPADELFEDQDQKSHDPGDSLKGWSNEVRVYVHRFDELSQACAEGRHDYCREGCLDLLMEPRLPKWTRVQTLQLVSILLAPGNAEYCLKEAQGILEPLDSTKHSTQLLMEDNENMMTDLLMWMGKKDEFGNDVEPEAGDGDVAMEDDLDDEDVPSEAWIAAERRKHEEFQHMQDEESNIDTPDSATLESGEGETSEEQMGLPSPKESEGEM